MLQISAALRAQIAAHGEANYPYEGCGLLLGYSRGAHNYVTAIRPLANVWPVEAEKRTRFRIDEREWLAAELDAADDGLDIVGIFHSHPDHPPVASPRDLAWAAFAGYSYLITAVHAGRAGDSRSWQINADRSGFDEEPIALDAPTPDA